MDDISLENIYSWSEDLVAREIEGELIIIPLVAGIGDMDDELYTLNDTGRIIWNLLDGNKSLKDVIEILTTEYETSRDIILKDVLGLVKELISRRMLVEKAAI